MTKYPIPITILCPSVQTDSWAGLTDLFTVLPLGLPTLSLVEEFSALTFL